MTRINLIAPTMMSGPHLLAEYRELPRIFILAYEACLRSESPNDPRNPRNPREYTLGPGHVRFFYPRLKFLERRFELLVDEMSRRGWSPNFTSPPPCYDMMSRHWCQDYEPTPAAISLNLARLRERDPEHYS